MQERNAEIFTGERAMFGAKGINFINCIFEDGESPLKHSSNLKLNECVFAYKYPLWYANDIKLNGGYLEPLARAGMWYSTNLSFKDALINAPKSYDEKAWAKFINENSKEILAKFAQILDRDLDAKGYEELTNKFLEQNGLKLKDLAQALRIALTGSSVSPSIFEVLEVVGSNEIKNRIQNLLKEEK